MAASLDQNGINGMLYERWLFADTLIIVLLNVAATIGDPHKGAEDPEKNKLACQNRR